MLLDAFFALQLLKGCFLQNLNTIEDPSLEWPSLGLDLLECQLQLSFWIRAMRFRSAFLLNGYSVYFAPSYMYFLFLVLYTIEVLMHAGFALTP